MKIKPVALLVMTIFCVLLIDSVVCGFNANDLAALKATNNCTRCDLSGANLSGANLKGANLSWTNLSETNLSGANLTGANLYETVLSWPNLTGTKLSGAIWTDGRTCAQGSVGQCNR